MLLYLAISLKRKKTKPQKKKTTKVKKDKYNTIKDKKDKYKTTKVKMSNTTDKMSTCQHVNMSMSM